MGDDDDQDLGGFSVASPDTKNGVQRTISAVIAVGHLIVGDCVDRCESFDLD